MKTATYSTVPDNIVEQEVPEFPPPSLAPGTGRRLSGTLTRWTRRYDPEPAGRRMWVSW
jgi:hypothetical protein